MKGSVKKLDTKSFTDTISAYGKHIQTFEGIVSGVKSTTSTLLDRWKGKGSKEYKSDCEKVQKNLKDITDIMNEVRDALSDAYAEYCETDSGLASQMKD